MEKKSIIAIVIVAIVIIIGGVFAFDYFTGNIGLINNKDTTDFDNAFMSGRFIGTVNEVKVASAGADLEKWVTRYKDSENKIEYNMSTCKNGSFLTDYLSIQGLPSPEVREYGGTEWEIYFSEAMPTVTNNQTNTSSNITYNLYICKAEKDNQSYIIYVISDSRSSVECDGSLYCELFTDYIQPLLESAELKHNSDAPEVYSLLGISESDYNQISAFMTQYKAGEIDINGNKISN
jgi:hypothetical protein